LTEEIAHQTLSEFGTLRWNASADYDGLESVIKAIAVGAVKISHAVQSAALVDVLGATGEMNVQGEMVQRLDKLGSDTFVETLSGCGRVAVVGSEELEQPVIAGDSEDHNYIVLMDPLDGSSNIDVAVSIGSIFGIWKWNREEGVSEKSLLKPGSEQIAAAYVVYGSSTVLVLATENNVQGFTLDIARGEFLLTHPDIAIPEVCPYYSANDGNYLTWDGNTKQAMTRLRDTFSQRYVGSLVADFHRNLLKGGIFLYPADEKRPEGRLRLMYEANPLGFIAEQAGGSASTGKQRILDIEPEELHQRTALILGNQDVVAQVLVDLSSG
jgi:fructose-1,6-bisphosphatase I